MNSLDFIISAVERRISFIEIEMDLIAQQLDIITTMPGVTDVDANILMLQHNISIAKHRYFGLYLQELRTNYVKDCSFKNTIQIHINSMDNICYTAFIDEVSGHQIAISSLTETSLHSNGGSTHGVLNSISYFFPFDLILPKIAEYSFFSKLLKIALDYTIEKHNSSLRDIVDLLKPSQIEKFVYIGIAEILLMFFVSDQISNIFDTKLSDFKFYENCQLMFEDNLEPISFDVKSSLQRSNVDLSKMMKFHIKKFEKITNFEPQFDEKSSNFLIPWLAHVILQLRKISTQVSISLMACSLWTAVDWINSAIISSEGQLIGADESFHYFVYILCEARLKNLCNIASTLETFCLSLYKTSKVDYLIQQLRSAEEFILTRGLKDTEFVLYPFNEYSGATSDLQVELHGFKVYAWKRYLNHIVPSVFRYTGNNNDISIAYKFPFNKMPKISGDFIKTRDGGFYQMSSEEYDNFMIDVETGDYQKSKREVELISNLLITTNPERKNPSKTSDKEQLENEFIKIWKTNDVFERIKLIQTSLMFMDKYDDSYKVTGVIDHRTMNAIKLEIEEFVIITPEVYSEICHIEQ